MSDPFLPTSVVARLDPEGRLRPRPLPETPSDHHSPVVKPRSGTEGRYHLVGEIARGGVGVVLKGHDTDLGRDVAMKVLREEHLKNTDVLQRFIEEAQIGGQLQHPGIVPVYEMGIGSDQRPYFTMKLIKGRTLATLLMERKDPATDRRRFLGIFESVCQTMAYAHARSVIHRDLKPANVMVGAFGEVLVVDWGMAKVLRGGADERREPAKDESNTSHASVIATVRSESGSSHSLAGSVLGTPRYMPPEQARGEVERMDARSDVFSLGALLCEILTGEPPYRGTQEEILDRAARGSLDAAYERLDGSGADAEIVDLVKSCLAPAREARPKDAGAVTQRLASYLASVEKRAHDAELKAAQAEVLAQGERWRRNAIAVLAILLLLSFWMGRSVLDQRKAQRQRVENANQTVSHAISKARLLETLAVAQGTLEQWRAAHGAAEQADALAHSTDADSATRSKAAAVLTDIAALVKDAESRAGQKARDDAMVARLDEVRMRVGEEWNAEAAERRYAQAFVEHGIDLQSLLTDEIVDRIEASSIRDRLLEALEDWNFRHGDSDCAHCERLREIILRIDEDPWRWELREAKSLDELKSLAIDPRLIEQPVASQLRLVNRLGSVDVAAAASLAERVQRRHVSDFWADFFAGYWMYRLHRPRCEEAVRYLTAALAVNDKAFMAWNRLGGCFRELSRYDEAVGAIEEAIRLRPDFAPALLELGLTRELRGDLEEAEKAYAAAARADPTDPRVHVQLGRLYVRLCDFERAAAELRESLRIDPRNAETYFGLGDVLQKKGEIEEALVMIRIGHSIGSSSRSWPYPSGKWLARAELLVALEPRLQEFLDGSTEPVSPVESTALAYLCYLHGHYLAAARLYEQAFEEPTELNDDAEAGNDLYDASVCMVLAGSGQGEDATDLDQETRSSLRGKALHWLSRRLKQDAREIEHGDPTLVRHNLEYWKHDPDLRFVREEQELQNLPPDERAAFHALWAQVDEVLARTRRPMSPR